MKKSNKKTIFIITILFFTMSLFTISVIKKDDIKNYFKSAIYYQHLNSERQELYNKLMINNVIVKSRTTGTAPFNTGTVSDTNGVDVSATDNIVRTLDKVRYTLEVSTNANDLEYSSTETDQLTGGVIKVKATLPNQGNNINLTWEADAWMKNVMISEDGTTLTAEYHASSDKNITTATQELSFTVLVGGYKQTVTTDILPEFEVWMEGNAPDNSSSQAASKKVKETNTFLISGTPSYNIQIANNYTGSKRTTKMINGVEVSGRYKILPIAVSLSKLDGMTDFRGVEFPKDSFTINIGLNYTYILSDNTSGTITDTTSDAIDILNGTLIQTSEINGKLNDNYVPNSEYVAKSDRLPYGELSLGTEKNSVYNSGEIDAILNGSNLTVTFSDFEVRNHFPTNPSNQVSLDEYHSNEGYILTGNIQFFLPFYGDLTEKNYYYLNATIDSAEYITTDGTIENITRGDTYINDKNLTDNTLSINFSNALDSTYTTGMYTYDYETGNVLETTGVRYGDASTLIGKQIHTRVIHGTGDGDYLGGIETLIVWDAGKLEYTLYDGYGFKYNTYTNSDYLASVENMKMKFGVSNDAPSTGLTLLDDINNAEINSFTWYSSLPEAQAAGKVAAVLIEDPNMYGSGTVRRYHVKFNVLDEESNIGETAIIRNKTIAYEDAERTITRQYKTEEYSPTTYDELGNIIEYENEWNVGKTILLRNNTSSVTIKAIENGEEKEKYDIQDTYINYEVTPTLTTELDNITIPETSVKVTLPVGLTYVEGSANKTPAGVTLNDDGTTLITWIYENWIPNNPAPDFEKITFQTEMDPTTENNHMFNTKAVIFNIGDKRDEVTKRTSTASSTVINLTGTHLSKKVDKNFADKGETIDVTTTIGLTSSSTLSSARIADILPKNNLNKSIINGTYNITLKTINSNQQVYYSTKSLDTLGLTIEDGKYSAQNIDLTTSDWTQVPQGGTIPYEATILVSEFTNIQPSTSYNYIYTINTSNSNAGDTYYFNSYLTNKYSTLIITNNELSATIVDRSISGKVSSGTDENNYSKELTINLLNSNNEIIQSTTTTNQSYKFENLARGEYYISFVIPQNYEVNNVSPNVVDTTGKSTLITSHNSSPTESTIKVENINMVLKRKQATLTVNHYIEGTTTKLADTETSTVYWGNNYSTTSASNLETNYNVVNQPTNVSGTVSGDITVNYYYKLKTATITTNHYIEGTTTKLVESVVQTKNYTEKYTTSSATVDSNYELASTPSNASGTVSGNVTVNYYYKLKTATITVNHYIEGTTTKLADTTTETKNYTDEYQTSAATVDSNYELVEPPSNASGTVSGNVTVNYYYKLKTATITTNYYIEGTTTELADTITETKKYTDEYQTSAATVDSNYELVETPSNASGTVSGNVTVNYYYKLKTATITVNHYIEGTTTKLADTVTETKKFTEQYTTSVAEVNVNYELVETPSNASGTVSGNVIVNYYYRLKGTNLIVNYYIENTSTKLAESVVTPVKWGDNYTTNPSDQVSNNYELISTPDNHKGTISSNNVTVNYYYRLKTATITINHYIEGTETKLADTTTETKKYTDKYQTSAANVDSNYELASTPSNATGIVSGNITVNYYYRLKTATIIVNYYIEGTTTKLIDSVIIKKKYTENYTTSLADVDKNYEPIETLPTNANGTVSGNITVNYYYRLKKATLTINHYIDGTTEKLVASETQIINFTQNYTTSPSRDISNNYELVSTPSNANGTISGDTIVNYYYRLKSSTIIVKHLEQSTNLELAPSDTIPTKYSKSYTTEVSKQVPANYQLITKTDNYQGIVETSNIEVIYYYAKKDSNITSSIKISGPTELTSKDSKLNYKIVYDITLNEYIGNGTITIVDTLPYEIDESKSSLANGIYDKTTKTITWTESWNNINTYNDGTKNVTKEISLVFKDIVVTEKTLTNSVSGSIKLDNNEQLIEDKLSTSIKIKGIIIVHHYLEGTTNKIVNDIVTSGIIGETYVSSGIEKEGYILNKKPNVETYTYQEETIEISYEYVRKQLTITTRTNGDGGYVEGDEVVFYGDDSTPNRIVITANDGFDIDTIKINGVDYKITDRKQMVLDKIENITEDIIIEVGFKIEEEDIIDNPETSPIIKVLSIVIIFTLLLTTMFLSKIYKNKYQKI